MEGGYPEFVKPEIGSKVVDNVGVFADLEDVHLQLDLLKLVLDHLHHLDGHDLASANVAALVDAAIAALTKEVHQLENSRRIWGLEQVVHGQKGFP